MQYSDLHAPSLELNLQSGSSPSADLDSSTPEIDALIAEVKEASDDHRFVQALGAFREAANLARGSKHLETVLVDLAIDSVRKLAKHNWRVAAALLAETGDIQVHRKIPDDIRSGLVLEERREVIANTLAEATNLELNGDQFHARQRVAATFQKYPDEKELQARLALLDLSIASTKTTQERNWRAGKLSAQRKALERMDDPAVLKATIQNISLEFHPFRSDTEIEPILSEIEDAGLKAAQAADLLAQDRIEDCIGICTSVLAHRPCFLIFLDLKEKAEAMLATSTHINALMDEGQITQAERACRQASALYPQSNALRDLNLKIESKVTEAQTLLENAQASLRSGDFDAAGEFFAQAVRLLPNDTEFADYLIDEIQSHAHSILGADCEAAQSTLRLGVRVRPGYEPPAYLAKEVAEELQRTATQRQQESDRKILAAIQLQLKSAETRQQLVSVRGTIAKSGLTNSSSAETSSESIELLAQLDRKIELSPKPGLQPRLTLSLAALSVAVLGFWAYSRFRVPPAPAVQLPIPEIATRKALPVPAVPPTVTPAPPETSRSTVERIPVPAARAESVHPPTEETPKDASAISTERQDWNDARLADTVSALNRFIKHYPESAYVPSAASEIEDLEWRHVDKNDADSLRQFASQFPAGSHGQSALEQAQNLIKNKRAQAEQNDWDAVDKSSPSLVAAYLSKYPHGAHSDAASTAVANFEHQASITATSRIQQADDSAWGAVDPRSQKSVDEYLSRFPSGQHLFQAHAALGDLHARAVDTASILGLIAKLQSAWDAKDFDSILALQRNIDRRTLKLQLSQAKTVGMTISPVSSPEITGMRATVTCRRQANEVFSDGSVHRNPELLVTYFLAKRNGIWSIDNIK